MQERTAALTRAHQGVRENEERLRMAMAVAQIAAWEWQLRTGRMTWSGDPEALFGFPRGAFGRELRMSGVIHAQDRKMVEEAVNRALETGDYQVEYRLVRPNGQLVWITERGLVVPEADGAPDRMVGVSRDVTAEREAAQEREQLLDRARTARDQAERQSRLKDEFLATLSHELRTPMNAILGWLSILESGKPVRDISSALDVLRRNAEIQARLIEDLLDMNRLLSGNFKLEISRVDVANLLRATIQGLQPAADAKGVQLTASVDSLPATVFGDTAATPAGAVEPGAQRHQVHRERRPGRDSYPAGTGGAGDRGARHWPGHRAGFPAARLRTIPPGGWFVHERGRRARSRALDFETPGRAARRHHRRVERGDRRGIDVRRPDPGDVGRCHLCHRLS